MVDKSSVYYIRAGASYLSIVNATSVGKSNIFPPHWHCRPALKPSLLRFQNPNHIPLTRTKPTYLFRFHQTKVPKTTPTHPKHIASHHAVTGSSKPLVNNGRIAASSTPPFLFTSLYAAPIRWKAQMCIMLNENVRSSQLLSTCRPTILISPHCP